MAAFHEEPSRPGGVSRDRLGEAGTRLRLWRLLLAPRRFGFISTYWGGKPLISDEVMIDLIAGTIPATG
ncbi:MAG: hypothetical protein ACRDLP_09790 [Solirubrobacteraceae bacterium]